MGTEAKSRPVKKVRYRDAAELAAALAGLAKDVQLPMAIALRVALMRKAADVAAEAFEAERSKRNRALIAARKTGEDPATREQRAFAALEEMEEEGRKTFAVRGSISWDAVERAVGDEKLANLGNIIAGLLPVLDGVPDLGADGA